MIKELLTPIIAIAIGLIEGGIYFLLSYFFTKKKEQKPPSSEESE